MLASPSLSNVAQVISGVRHAEHPAQQDHPLVQQLPHPHESEALEILLRALERVRRQIPLERLAAPEEARGEVAVERDPAREAFLERDVVLVADVHVVLASPDQAQLLGPRLSVEVVVREHSPRIAQKGHVARIRREGSA
jgi:hypothetical protein